MNYKRIEDHFRIWAFSQYYQLYADEQSNTIRFCKALIASSRPVPYEAIVAWHQTMRDTKRTSSPSKRMKIVKTAIREKFGVPDSIGDAGRQ